MQAASAKPPKPPKPLLDPESEAAKHIERLKQANREWQTRCRVEKHHFEEEKKRISKKREMPKATHNVIIKALHPDHWPMKKVRQLPTSGP
jgi:hypothetical protein